MDSVETAAFSSLLLPVGYQMLQVSLHIWTVGGNSIPFVYERRVRFESEEGARILPLVPEGNAWTWPRNAMLIWEGADVAISIKSK